ncbi:hypothetical protein T484DRAFT_1851874, partial [Baffinella frigidus]
IGRLLVLSVGKKLILSAEQASLSSLPYQGPAASMPGGRSSGDSTQLLRELAMQSEREKLQATQLLRALAMQSERETLQAEAVARELAVLLEAEAVARELAVQLEEERRVQRVSNASQNTSMDGQALKEALAAKEADMERERREYDQALKNEIQKRRYEETRATNAQMSSEDTQGHMIEIERLRVALDEGCMIEIERLRAALDEERRMRESAG